MRALFNLLLHNRLPHLWNWLSVRIDLVFFIVAIIYSLPSLGYPFGRDQGLHFYIGREWLNGLVPYRDAFDNKPPGIYFLHALSILVLGAQQWSIRVVELLSVLCMGLITARAVRRDMPRRSGEVGLITLLTAGFYFTCFDYWDTAQVESWEGLALIASYAVAETDSRPWQRAVCAGALAGVAFLFKLPAAVVGIVIAVRVALHAGEIPDKHRIHRMSISAVLYGAGALGVIGMCAAYFAVQGGVMDMVDVLFGFNMYCALNSPVSSALGNAWAISFWFDHCDIWILLTFLSWLSGIILAIKRRAWWIVRGAFMAMVLCLSTAATVWIQHKFYSYHWVVVLPFLALCAGYGIAEGMHAYPRITTVIAIAGLFLGIDSESPWLINNKVDYGTVTSSFWEYVRGYQGRTVYLEKFTGGNGYNYRNQEVIGDMIRDRAKPGDQVIVRGFEPTIYTVSGLRSPSRFFIENPLHDPFMNYNRAEWSSKHERTCWTHPPRFVVAFSRNKQDVDSILARGYFRVSSVAQFVLLERKKR